ncbi:isoleucine-tRNA ligase [Vermiconidia calcicola]|uniref:Isoleucine-tRNA ligase n=1 Tax=Vermiconidia calcicola TaxID=1690605 RepID=A0ACC3NEN5_9PEZI|nr:isoleucine-tRNA ligase [Vermiconidia calcicola]
MPLFFPSRILRAATQNANPLKCSDTLALPKSSFPARPSAAQLEQYRQRCADDLYTWQRANRPQTVRDAQGKEVINEFILHDGPPYANGAVHVGHALNKVLKDLVLRWHMSTGKRVQYTPGWDCHGLPIELKALQAQRTQTEQASALQDAPKQEANVATGVGMSAPEIRKVARELATQTIEKQKKSFKEWGIVGEWDKPYKTMDVDFEIRQLEVFKEMVRKGLISRHHRPVYWSPSSRTALAEAELEYDDNHKCTAAFIKMPFLRMPTVLEQHPALEDLQDFTLSALVWTTTPWTLPANQAIAFNSEMFYSVISLSCPSSPEESASKELLVVAKERVDHVFSFLPEGTTANVIVDNIVGMELHDGRGACWNMFQDSESRIALASFVTASSGTGIVHMAPGHGMEDYQVCEEESIGSAFAPVDDEGKFTAAAFSAGGYSDLLQGLDVQTEGVDAVLRILRNTKPYRDREHCPDNFVLATHDYTHKNPIDWRTKQPVIVRATAQWFADVSAIKDRALAALDDVHFVPEGGKTRLRSFVEGRSQWCISRQRAWGVPIPVLYHQETGEACIREESVDHIINMIDKKGTDAWSSDPPDDPSWVHPSLAEQSWIRGKDTMDVWFDSGTTWTTLAADSTRESKPVSDMYLEGTDQHRGWFQSSLLTAIATQEADGNTQPKAPFGQLVTHGFTLDADGRKMSKSLGNVVSPDQILDGSLLPPVKARKQKGKSKDSASKTNDAAPKYDAMGPDALRLWVASSDYTRDVSISIPVLQSVQQALQKYRVTFKFLLGVLADYEPQSLSLEQSESKLTFADRAVLHQLASTSTEVRKSYEEYRFYKAISDVNAFINAELSAFYFEVIKDTMYAGSTDVRKRTQAVLKTIVDELMRMLGPVTPHLVEEVWEYMPEGMKSAVHPLRRVWEPSHHIESDAAAANGGIEDGLEVFRTISAAVKVAQEEARRAGKLGSGLACKVQIHIPPASESNYRQYVEQWAQSGELADLLVVSQAVLSNNDRDTIEEAEWRYEQPVKVGSNGVTGHVVVLPPDYHKCVRCWKYTAEEAETPCARCRDVLKEKGH